MKKKILLNYAMLAVLSVELVIVVRDILRTAGTFSFARTGR